MWKHPGFRGQNVLVAKFPLIGSDISIHRVLATEVPCAREVVAVFEDVELS
jgi:hypothetical protein